MYIQILKSSFIFVRKHPRLIFIRIIGFVPYLFLGIMVGLSISKGKPLHVPNAFYIFDAIIGAYVLSAFMKVCNVLIHEGAENYGGFFQQANYFFLRILALSIVLWPIRLMKLWYLNLILGGLIYPLEMVLISIIVVNDYSLRDASMAFFSLFSRKFYDFIKIIVLWFSCVIAIPAIFVLIPAAVVKLMLFILNMGLPLIIFNIFYYPVLIINKLSVPFLVFMLPYCLTAVDVFILKTYLELRKGEIQTNKPGSVLEL